MPRVLTCSFRDPTFLVYDEDEGFSGGNTSRPAFQRLLADAAKRKFDALICYGLDRISRNESDFSRTLEALSDVGVAFISLREQFDTSTSMGRAAMYVSSVFAQLERDTITERIRDNLRVMAKEGRWLGDTAPTGGSPPPQRGNIPCGISIVRRGGEASTGKTGLQL